jgi:hypothetical protein
VGTCQNYFESSAAAADIESNDLSPSSSSSSSLKTWLEERTWNIDVVHVTSNANLSAFDELQRGNNKAQVVIVDFSCDVGVQLPFLLLSTVQALTKRYTSSPTPVSNGGVSFFSGIDLIYYTEADQVLYLSLFLFLHSKKCCLAFQNSSTCFSHLSCSLSLFLFLFMSLISVHISHMSIVYCFSWVTCKVTSFSSFHALHSIGSSLTGKDLPYDIVTSHHRIKKTGVITHHHGKEQLVVISPQRIVMRFSSDDVISSRVTCLSEAVNNLLSDNNSNNHSDLLALSNACVKCPYSLCSPSSSSSTATTTTTTTTITRASALSLVLNETYCINRSPILAQEQKTAERRNKKDDSTSDSIDQSQARRQWLMR